ncbi:PREDICTED: homeobox protein 2-like [Ceratosolen solmsi marchali]|uniref:Homeobox protein 2-like n=1 Tax=Ceratosolen solmsi marchali TaxID=326594 RepID=A0AAJ6YI65_9HYME|nr:PREDICTED: homeobox protein 2-like [Ceratosolen solmsi marchali]
MHRGSRLLLWTNKALNTQILLLVLVFSGLDYFTNNFCIAGGSSDAKACQQINCKNREECVTRKFWCEHSPCPSITYCSKSKKDSLKGPENCDSVLCTAGYTCVVQNRDCEWNQSFMRTECKEHTARCVSEWELKINSVSCLDSSCPTDHRCILRESQCNQAPCKLTKTCALATDGNNYSKNVYCRGWVCPPYQECMAGVKMPCHHDKCQIIRSCQGSLTPRSNASPDIQKNITKEYSQTTLADLERDTILERNSKPQKNFKPMIIWNDTRKIKSDQYYDAITPERLVTSSPTIRSTSTEDLPWLTYFKNKIGSQTIQYWIQKSKNNENYEGFVNWLESISNVLDKETFRLWLYELENISANIPQFQAWILLYSLNAGPFDYLNRNRPLKNTDETMATNEYNTDAPVENQGVSTRIHHGSEFDSTSPQHHSHPLNFHFNEPQRVDEIPKFYTKMQKKKIIAPSISQSMLLPLLYGIRNHKMAHNSNLPNYKYEISKLHVKPQNHNNINKTLLKPWQTYYWPNSTTTNIPRYSPQLPIPVTNYYNNAYNNYSREYKNPRQDVDLNMDMDRQQQMQWLLTNNNRNVQQLSDLSSNQWSPEDSVNNVSLKKIQIIDNDLHRREFSPENERENENVSMEVNSLINQIKGEGLSRNDYAHQNILKADKNENPHVLRSPIYANNNLPKLLIYFPPPFNFFLYYSVKSQSQNTSDNSFHILSPTKTKYTRMIKPWQNYNHQKTNENNSEKKIDNSNKFNFEKNTEQSIKLKKQYKQKEFAYIRKIIRELVEYWDDEEKNLENFTEYDYDNKEENNSLDNKMTKPVFNAFLEWLSKKNYKDLPNLNQKLRKKQPLDNERLEKQQIVDENYNHNQLRSANFTTDTNNYMNNSNDLVTKKIRILVDIEKNPEILQSFFKRHSSAHNNKSDNHDYQIIINLQDFFDSKEEDRISRKLVHIASNQLHRNLTRNQKLPKLLWIFPIYEDEENDTLITELENHPDHFSTTDENKSTPYKFDESQNVMNYLPNKTNNKVPKNQKDNSNMIKHDLQITEHKKNDRPKAKERSESKKDNNNNNNHKKQEGFKDRQNKRNIKKTKAKQQLAT